MSRQVTMNSEGYNSDGPAKGGVGSKGWDDTITPADSITEIIQSSPYDRRAGEAQELTELLREVRCIQSSRDLNQEGLKETGKATL